MPGASGPSPSASRPFTTRPTLRGSFGMVSSSHWLASATAMGVLERGGNVFDAAVSAGFVLHVAEPHLNGPGGEVPALISTAAEKTPKVLCGQGVAPAGATIAHFRDLGLDQVPGAGLLAATVPGAVDAWLLLLRDHGTWSLRDVLDAAIGYARCGSPLSPGAVDTIAKVSDLFAQDWPTSAWIWMPHGQVPKPESMYTNKAYADTLELLVLGAERAGGDRETQLEHARRTWREGFVAEAIDAFAKRRLRHPPGEEHAGVLTGSDLATWSASWEDPTTLDWNGYTVAKTGPWGQGPVLLQTLAILAAHGDLDEVDLESELGMHFTVEAMKLAMSDREAWYGDALGVPMQLLLSPSYAESRARLLGSLAAEGLRPGAPEGRTPTLPEAYSGKLTTQLEHSGAVGEPTVRTRSDGTTLGDTSHVDVVDRWGNMISATPSGGWLQSSPAVPELGFCLGSRAQMFWLEEGLPSSLEPRRRPRTTLSPTLVMRDGEPVLACGSPGGDQQDQWQLLFLLRHLGAGLDIQEAIDAPAWHTSAFPGSFWPRSMAPRSLIAEDRIPEEVLRALARRRHTVSRSGAWSQGRLCAVSRDPETGMLAAGANPRGMHGYAAGR